MVLMAMIFDNTFYGDRLLVCSCMMLFFCEDLSNQYCHPLCKPVLAISSQFHIIRRSVNRFQFLQPMCSKQMLCKFSSFYASLDVDCDSGWFLARSGRVLLLRSCSHLHYESALFPIYSSIVKFLQLVTLLLLFSYTTS